MSRCSYFLSRTRALVSSTLTCLRRCDSSLFVFEIERHRWARFFLGAVVMVVVSIPVAFVGRPTLRGHVIAAVQAAVALSLLLLNRIMEGDC